TFGLLEASLPSLSLASFASAAAASAAVAAAAACAATLSARRAASSLALQHFLYLLPEPQGHGSFLPTFIVGESAASGLRRQKRNDHPHFGRPRRPRPSSWEAPRHR